MESYVLSLFLIKSAGQIMLHMARKTIKLKAYPFSFFSLLSNIKKMQKTDANPQSPTICRRLVNFMLSLPLRSPPSRPIPIENGSPVHEESSFKSINKTLSSDLVVELRHADLEDNKALVHASKKGDIVLGNEKTIIRKIQKEKEDVLTQPPQRKNGFQIQQKGKELQDLEILHGTDTRLIKSLKTSNPVLESVDLSAGQAMKQKHWPLLREDSKINEKSAEFIETRKEAMWKTYHLHNN